MNDHIQISDVTPRIQYAADGTQTQFSFPFPIFDEDDLEVYIGDTKQTSGYSVLGAGTSFGGSVTFDAPPASGVIVTLHRFLTIERTTDFQQSGTFRAKVLNNELDYLTAALQQVADDVGRAVRLSPTSADADLELPSRAERANKVLGFDANGNVIAASSSGTGAGVTDHGQLTGLSDDDHIQYHDDARGDARYYTQAQIDASLDSKSDNTHNHDVAYAAITHVSDTGNPHGVTKSQVGLANVENIKTNLSATVDPSQNDDGIDGYVVGSRWINTVADREFVCLDAALGAAVWIETTQSGGGGVSDHGDLTGLGNDDHTQYHTDSRADSWLTSKTLDDIPVGASNKHFDATDKAKLDGIEPGATSDMTGGEIKAAYEAEVDTNAFTDTEKVKLAGIEAGAEVNTVDTVFGQTGQVDIISLAEELSPTSNEWVVVEKSSGGFRKAKTSNLSAGITDHGQLTGLSNDDHSQYHNDARGDARYYTRAQIDASLDSKSDNTHNHDVAYAAITHVSDTGNPHGVAKSQVGLANVENIKTNLSATVDPSQNDDGIDGYVVGSRWINTVADREFVCLDAALGAAVWIETTQSGGGTALDTIELSDSATAMNGRNYLLTGGSGKTLMLPATVAANSSVGVSNRSGSAWTISRNGKTIEDAVADVTLQDGLDAVFAYGGINNWLLLRSVAGGISPPVLPSGTSTLPSSIPAGGSVEVVVPISGIEPATHAVTFLHVPSANAKIARYGVVTATDQATVTLTNIGTTEITGLFGNVTVKADTIAGAPGLSGTAAMPSSIPAGVSVEIVVTIVGVAPPTHAVTFLHVPSTNAEIGRYGVITATNQATVTVTNNGTTAITGLSGNITVKAESIS